MTEAKPQHPATVPQLATQQAQQSFLACFAETGSTGAACLASGIPVGTVDSWESRDTQGFKSRKAEVLQLALGKIEAEITRRGVDGIEKKMFNTKGELTGSTWQYSDNLLMFRAKRLDPEYRDNPRLQQANAAPSHTVINIIVPEGAKVKGQVVEGESRPVEEGQQDGV